MTGAVAPGWITRCAFSVPSGSRQIACAHEDPNALRRNSVFKLGQGRLPPDSTMVLAGAPAIPELMQLACDDPDTDVLFGLTGNPVLARFAQPFLDTKRQHHALCCEQDRRRGQPEPQSTRTDHEADCATGSWPQPL